MPFSVIIDGRNTLGVHFIATASHTCNILFIVTYHQLSITIGLIYSQNMADIAVLNIGWKNSDLHVSVGKLLDPILHGIVSNAKAAIFRKNTIIIVLS